MEIIGVDIGGTKIHAGLIRDGFLIKSSICATEVDKPKEYILENLLSAIDQLITPETKALGIGIPGIIDQEQGIIYEPANLDAWQNFNLKEALEKQYGIPVHIDNDANCFAKGTSKYGVANGYKHIVGLTLGTGLGAGIISDEKLINGAKNGAGEFGQIPYLDSIFESYCSGQFFIEIKNIKGEELLAKAHQNDPLALKVWYEFGKHLGKLITTIVYSCAPEAIVFGGSVSKGFTYFLPGINEVLRTVKIRSVVNDLILLNEENKDIAVLGAAALCH